MSQTLVVLSTVSSPAEAKKIARILVTEKLAACVNIFPKIESHYWWKGKIAIGREVLILIKTRRSSFKRLAHRVRQIHSYDVPELIALPVALGWKPYLDWIATSMKRPRP